MYLTTSGNHILDAAGRPFRLVSVSWYGANEDAFVPHGLWAVNWRDALDSMKAMGFNSLRLPLSGVLADSPMRWPKRGVIDFARNPDLVGRNAHQILRLILDRCAEIGLRVILDMHQRTETSGIDGDPLGSSGLGHWVDLWRRLAGAYGGHPAVVGAELYNEPHTLDWGTWASYVEACGDAVHQIAPHWLIFVQGVATHDGVTYWWGGNLRGVAERPVVLRQPDRLVYVAHDYAHTSGGAPWLRSLVNRVADYPANLIEIFRANWGFVFERGFAPLWIGEFGGSFGFDDRDGTLAPASWPDYLHERAWLEALLRFCAPEGHEGISMGYWCWNGGGGQHYGLTDAGYVPQASKLALLRSLLKARG